MELSTQYAIPSRTSTHTSPKHTHTYIHTHAYTHTYIKAPGWSCRPSPPPHRPSPRSARGPRPSACGSAAGTRCAPTPPAFVCVGMGGVVERGWGRGGRGSVAIDPVGRGRDERGKGGGNRSSDPTNHLSLHESADHSSTHSTSHPPSHSSNLSLKQSLTCPSARLASTALSTRIVWPPLASDCCVFRK
jgi:hypothetical protein